MVYGEAATSFIGGDSLLPGSLRKVSDYLTILLAQASLGGEKGTELFPFSLIPSEPFHIC